MKQAHFLGYGLLTLLFLGACGQPTATPPSGAGHIEGQVVLPPAFTNGTPFTQSTPFTNSIPLKPLDARGIATTLPDVQTVEAIDPASGRVLAQARTSPEGRFSLALPPASQPVLLQVVVKDAWGRIFGLIATTTQPMVPGTRTLSAGSTVAPLAGALSVGEAERVTFGAGFAGVPRPKLARVLKQLDTRTTERAGQSFDAQFQELATANALMRQVAQTADRLAGQALAGTSQDPEAIGTRLGTALTMDTEAPSPTPSPPSATPSPAPTRRPSPKPTRTPWGGDGHAPALPAPWPPKP
ncbi:hypothetical protein J7643_00730 [bacterium]|nr:hypothetical protein [bacterium]